MADLFVGDWCSLQPGTPKSLLGRTWSYVLSREMVDFTTLAGNDDDVRHFTELANRFREGVITKEILSDGKVTGDTQTGYALVTRFGLYRDDQKSALIRLFEARLKKDDFGIKTGFHCTGQLLQGLTAIGLQNDASKIILQEKFPSWGYMIQQGATTIWEHWDGKTGPET